MYSGGDSKVLVGVDQAKALVCTFLSNDNTACKKQIDDVRNVPSGKEKLHGAWEEFCAGAAYNEANAICYGKDLSACSREIVGSNPDEKPLSLDEYKKKMKDTKATPEKMSAYVKFDENFYTFRACYKYLAPKMAQAGTEPPKVAVPMPKVLADYIDSIKGEYPLIAKNAERLFREAMALVPPDEQLAAAKNVAEGVKTWAGNSVDVATAATADDAKAKAKAKAEAEEAAVKSYVADVEGKEASYGVNIQEAPKELFDVEKLGLPKGTKLDLGAIENLRRLFVQARMSAKAKGWTGGKDYTKDDAPLAEKTAAAVKAEKDISKKDLKQFAADLEGFKASAVLNDADKTIKEVKLEKYPPAERLIDALGARGNKTLEMLLQEIWNDAMAKAEAKAKAKGGKVSGDMQKAMIDSLVGQLGGKLPEDVARAYVQDVDKNGKVTLEFMPGIAPDVAKGIGQDLGWRVARKMVELYKKAEEAMKRELSPAERAKIKGQIATRALNIILFEDHRDISIKGTGKKPRVTDADTLDQKVDKNIKAVVDLLDAQFDGFDDKGDVKAFEVKREGSTVSAFIDEEKKLHIGLGLEGHVSYVDGVGARGSGGQVFVKPSLGLEYTVNNALTFSFAAKLFLAKLAETLAPADEGSSMMYEEDNAAPAIFLLQELYGGAKLELSPVTLSVKGGIVNKRPNLPDYGLGESALWYGMLLTLASSRTPGGALDATIDLLGERLKVASSIRVNAYKGGIPLNKEPSVSGGGVFGAALGISGTPTDRLEIGASGSVMAGFGGNYEQFNPSDPLVDPTDPRYDTDNSADGQAIYTLGLGGEWSFGERKDHKLGLNYRGNFARNEHGIDSDQHILAIRSQNPLYRGDRFQVLLTSLFSYMNKSGEYSFGMPSGSGSCVGPSCVDVGNGTSLKDTDTAIGLMNQALEFLVAPQLLFRWDRGAQDGISLQPFGAFLLTAQQGASLEPGFTFGLNFGITKDFIK